MKHGMIISFFQDAKEHLSALADKLGPSLTDIDVSFPTPFSILEITHCD